MTQSTEKELLKIHEELKRLILRRDEEEERDSLLQRVITIEKDVKKIKQRVFA